jgi:hypothetical protein
MPKSPEKNPFIAIGSTGLKQSGGYIDEEWHPKLRGTYAPKVYREMADNSSAIGAIRYIIRALVRQVEWRVDSASDDKQAVDAAVFVESCLLDMSHTFEDFISEVLSFLEYGWSYFEVVYKLRKGETKDSKTRSKYEDGKIGWRKLALRPQETLDKWDFDSEDGGLKGMHQYDSYSGKKAFIPIERSILFRTETFKGNPEGRSIFRNAVVDYFYLKRICEIEAIGIERDMTGLITMEVPIRILQQASEADKALFTSITTMLSQLKRDEREYALVPPELDPEGKPTGYKLKLLSTGGRRQIETTDVKLYYKTGILQSVFAQFIQLGMAGVGSFALASSQTDLFAVALGAFMDVIASTFSRYGIGRLMELNKIPAEYWPTLEHGDIETPPLAEIGAYVQALAGAGQLPEDAGIKRKLLEFAKLPQPEKPEGE